MKTGLYSGPICLQIKAAGKSLQLLYQPLTDASSKVGNCCFSRDTCSTHPSRVLPFLSFRWTDVRSWLRFGFQVLPGARIPADGTVEAGQSHVDESMLTGEALPVSRKRGDLVIGGTMNMGGMLQVRMLLWHGCASYVGPES